MTIPTRFQQESDPGTRPEESQDFLHVFSAAAEKSGGALRFDAFMELALYHPRLGYYRRSRSRVGRDRSTDFYTSTSLGPIFGELVAAAAAELLCEAGLNPSAHTFVEIGAEPAGGVLADVPGHGFAAAREVVVGEPAKLTGDCVVFSNELFDAQPVRRFVRAAHGWRELAVAINPNSGALVEVDGGAAGEAELLWLPQAEDIPQGYRFDAPFAAMELAENLAGDAWRGLFIAIDYGKRFAELAEEHPFGTARSYRNHAQVDNLLSGPGEQDITAHVCWDWLEAALVKAGCSNPKVETQESFLVRYAGKRIAKELERAGLSLTDPRRRALQHLLHPAQLGSKFQVLHAVKHQCEAKEGV